MRDRLDPDRVFTNAYLRRVLGDSTWHRAQTLAGPLGIGARQPRRIASIRQPKQSSTPGSATSHHGWSSSCGEHRPGRPGERRGRVELAAEDDRHPAGEQVAEHPAADRR